MIRIAGSRAAGKGHLLKAEPCQDAVAFFRDRDAACVALADGAGSLRYSHFASETITRCISQYIATNFDALFFSDSIKEKIYSRCIECLEALDIPMNEMACTMLCVAMKNNNAILVHVGDGMIINVNEGAAHIVSGPENGQSQNETYFITEYMDMNRLRVSVTDMATGIYMLMSDGTMESLYERKSKTIAPAAIKIASWLHMADEEAVSNKIKETLETLFRQKTADDMSLIMISAHE